MVQKMPIPSDLSPEMCEYVICWPRGDEWQAILRGLLTTPERGRFWDEKTGSIIDVQDVGKAISAKNIHVQEKEVIMACTSEENFQDLIMAIQDLTQAVNLIEVIQEGIETSITQQTTLMIENNATAYASSFAEALSFSNSEAIVFPSISPPSVAPGLDSGSSPEPEDGNEFGLTNVPIQYDPVIQSNDIACQVAHDIIDAVTLFVGLQASIYDTYDGVLPPVAIMSQLSSVAEGMIREDPAIPFLLPRPVLVVLSSLIAAASISGTVGLWFEELEDWLVQNREQMADAVYCVRDLDPGTLRGVALVAAVVDSGEPDLNAFQKSYLMALFGAGQLGAVLFERVGYTQPATNTEECSSCGS